jgi:hypothetical protein
MPVSSGERAGILTTVATGDVDVVRGVGLVILEVIPGSKVELARLAVLLIVASDFVVDEIVPGFESLGAGRLEPGVQALKPSFTPRPPSLGLRFAGTA